MRTTTFTLALAILPAALCAQASGSPPSSGKTTSPATTTQASAQAQARTDVSLKAPKGWTAEGSAKLDAMYAETKQRDLPPEPIAKRVSEGSAKGASETTILASAGKVKANMEAAQDAMVAAGRHPSQDESERGAMAMEHGVTKADIEAMAKSTPSDRSLVVAFEVLGKLAARGVPVTQALAEIQAKIDARASDQALIALGSKGAASGSAASGSQGAAGSNAGTSASGAVTGTAKGVTGAVAGSVTGVVKKP